MATDYTTNHLSLVNCTVHTDILSYVTLHVTDPGLTYQCFKWYVVSLLFDNPIKMTIKDETNISGRSKVGSCAHSRGFQTVFHK